MYRKGIVWPAAAVAAAVAYQSAEPNEIDRSLQLKLNFL